MTYAYLRLLENSPPSAVHMAGTWGRGRTLARLPAPKFFAKKLLRGLHMQDAVITAAETYTRHILTCPVCSGPVWVYCSDGLKLLLQFQDAFHDYLNRGRFDA